MPDPSDAFRRFASSMVLDVEKWRDGIPYDVPALDEMSEEERGYFTRQLVEKPQLDWRDVAALKRIGTPRALARMKTAADYQTDGGGAAALKAEIENGWSDMLERQLLGKLEGARLMESSTDRLFSIAEEHPTPAVRETLFRLATTGEVSMRYAHAAFLVYLNGHAEDWYGLSNAHRPHFLNLQETGPDHDAAVAWLKAKIDKPKKRRASKA